MEKGRNNIDAEILGKLIAILRPALTGTAPETLPEAVSEEEWRTLYAFCSAQKIQGLLHEGVNALPEDIASSLPLDVAAKLSSDALRIAETHRRHREEIARQETMFSRLGVKAVMLKGLCSAARYPHPESRVLGDIDWWIPSRKDRSKALDAIRGRMPERDSDFDVHYVTSSGIVVEHHRKGYRLEGDDGERLLQLEHLFHHAAVGGVTLRHLCDYAALRYSLRDAPPGEEYVRLTSRLGLEEWAQAVDALADHMLFESELSAPAGAILNFSSGLTGTAPRVLFCLKIAPRRFFLRFSGLVMGRMCRIMTIFAD